MLYFIRFCHQIGYAGRRGGVGRTGFLLSGWPTEAVDITNIKYSRGVGDVERHKRFRFDSDLPDCILD